MTCFVNRPIWLLVLLVCTCLSAQAQERMKQQVLILKNGSQVRGQLLERGDRFVLLTADGSKWVFAPDEVQEVEEAINPNLYKERGFLHSTEIGILTGKPSTEFQNITSTALNIRTFNGYQFFPALAVGFTTGIEGYEQIVSIPLALGVRGDLLKKKRVTPFYALDLGGGASWAHSRQDFETDASIGFGWAAALGLKVRMPQQTGLTLSMGFQQQRASSTFENWWWWGNGSIKQNYIFNRLAMRVGFTF